MRSRPDRVSGAIYRRFACTVTASSPPPVAAPSTGIIIFRSWGSVPTTITLAARTATASTAAVRPAPGRPDGDLRTMSPAHTSVRAMATGAVNDGQHYQALKALRSLLDREERLFAAGRG